MTVVYIVDNKVNWSTKRSIDQDFQWDNNVEQYMERSFRMIFYLYYLHLDKDENMRHKVRTLDSEIFLKEET